MADSSILTLGTAQSLLVDSSVYDSRIAETTKDHVFLGMGCEDGEGQCILSFFSSLPKFLKQTLKVKMQLSDLQFFLQIKSLVTTKKSYS